MNKPREIAELRAQHSRQRLAYEAARVMALEGVTDYEAAKSRAANRLGIGEAVRAIPRSAQLRDTSDCSRAGRSPPTVRRRTAALEQCSSSSRSVRAWSAR